jgi:hypothetical protein
MPAVSMPAIGGTATDRGDRMDRIDRIKRIAVAKNDCFDGHNRDCPTMKIRVEV